METITFGPAPGIFRATTAFSTKYVFITQRGGELADRGLYEQAVSAFTEAIQESPNFWQAYYNRGIAYAHQSQPDLALADFGQVIELAKPYPATLANALHNRGIVYTQKGQYELALADFNQILKLKAATERGSWAPPVIMRGSEIQSQTGSKQNPEDPDAYYMRGVVYLKQGRIDRALPDFTKAVELDAHFAKAYGNRGVAYAMQGQMDPALRDLN
ncbi:MAG: tetratricopeptide repeat protein, partial [Deltaproteobacteria bacterium]|nr:tetratricopeptide repeat protein [Deltaproteobacteria bacterium]